ncbi:response regulator [Vibrio ponticus]|nr:response regulator [Vibrio ponticus]
MPAGNIASHKQRIMLVDDDPTFRRITSAYLEAQGYEVIEAEDGLEGLKFLRDLEPDLVLCDLAMPVLNGVEFVEEVSVATHPCR